MEDFRALWALVGILLWIIEISEIPKPLFVTGIFGTASLIVALFTGAKTSVSIQLLFFIVISAVFILSIKPVIIKYFYDREKQAEINTEALVVGKTGLVMEVIDTLTGTLTVKIGGDIWRAVIKKELKVDIGQQVIVTHVEGCTVMVDFKKERS